jgi:hypothetical protein
MLACRSSPVLTKDDGVVVVLRLFTIISSYARRQEERLVWHATVVLTVGHNDTYRTYFSASHLLAILEAF